MLALLRHTLGRWDRASIGRPRGREKTAPENRPGQERKGIAPMLLGGGDLPINLALQGVHHDLDRGGVRDAGLPSVEMRQLDELASVVAVGIAAGDELFLSSHCRFPFRCRFLFAARPDRALADAAQDGR